MKCEKCKVEVEVCVHVVTHEAHLFPVSEHGHDIGDEIITGNTIDITAKWCFACFADALRRVEDAVSPGE